MDSACVYDLKTVIHELTQGRKTAQQLRASLHSPEARDEFIRKILSSHQKALLLLQSSISYGSPGTEEIKFDQPFSGQQGENIISRKRKWSTTWEDQVRTCIDNGLEGETDDGFSWRKYGQKDIQGAKFPRSYYRCSYRNAQKCFATKQVQRKDEDPKVFDMVYKGKHTCDQVSPSASSQPLSPPPVPEKHEITPTHVHQLSPPSPGEMLSNLRTNLSVNTSDLNGESDTIPSLSSFPSTSFELMEDNHQLHFPNYYDDDDGLLQGYSPAFLSPDTSKSDFFTRLESSHESFDFLADVDLEFEFKNSPFLEG